VARVKRQWLSDPTRPFVLLSLPSTRDPASEQGRNKVTGKRSESQLLLLF